MDHPSGELSDREIIEQVLGGYVNAFEFLLERYQDQVFGTVLKHIPYEKAEEVAQEVFVRAYQSLSSFNGSGSFKQWLSGVAVRCCYDFWREHYRRRELPISSLTEDHERWIDSLLSVQSQEAFYQKAREQEAREILEWAMDKLSAEDRTVLTLVYLDDCSVKEASNLLNWSIAKVKVRAHRARHQLRKVLSGLLPAGKGGHEIT